MQHRNYLGNTLNVLLLLGMVASSVHAQSDTVRYRLLKSRLSDSTLIRFELGSVGFKHGSDLRYLRFTDTLAGSINAYFKTDTFTVVGSSDSILFFRLASFDDKYDPGAIPCGEMGSASWDSAIAIIKHRTVDSNIIVSPDTSVFNSASTITYNTELHSAATDALLLTVDTLLCFRSASGRLSYTTFPTIASGGAVGLTGISAGTHVYVTVHRFVTLPYGSSILGDEFGVDAINPPYNGPHKLNDTEAIAFGDRGLYIPPPAPLAKVATATISDGTRSGIYNPFTSLIKRSFDVNADGLAEIQLVNAAGQCVLRTTNMLHAGSNTIAIDTRGVPTGRYLLLVQLNGLVVSNSSHLVIH